VKPKKKPSTHQKKPGVAASTFAPSSYTAASFAPVTQSVWAEMGESPVVEALTEAQAAIPYGLSKPNAKRPFESASVADLQGRCFLTPHVAEFHWRPARHGAAPVKVCRCIQGLGGDIGTRSKEELAMWMLDLTGQVDPASAETAYTAAKTCRTPNETWIAKGNYRQHLHQKEIAALPAPVQSLSAKPNKNKQIHDGIDRPQVPQDRQAPADWAVTRSTHLCGGCPSDDPRDAPKRCRSGRRLRTVRMRARAPEPPVSATPCSNAFAALAPPPTSESEAEEEHEYETDPGDNLDGFFDEDFFDALGTDEEAVARRCIAAVFAAAPMARTNSTPPERTAADWANIHLLTNDATKLLSSRCPHPRRCTTEWRLASGTTGSTRWSGT
jgi:hypothetical protein